VPGDVTGLSAAANSPHAITLTWNAYGGADFLRYEVRRRTTAGVTRTDALVDTLSATSVTDSGLVAYTTYYYRVFVVDTTDAASVGVETSARTKSLSYPHSDPVDSVNLNFSAGGAWSIVKNGTGDEDAYTGEWHWSDSPGGNYAPNTNASLTMTVNLGTAIMPVLTYWERYSFEPNADYGFIEISLDGTTWTQAGFVTGSQTVWTRKQIDLTQWAGYSEVRIRFRVQSNSATESDGWHIDDLTIAETPTPSLPYPFVDTFESDSTNSWLASSWSLTTGGHTAPNAITDSKLGNYPRDTKNHLVSLGVLDLSGAVNPVLTFWHKYWFYTNHSCCTHNEDDYGRVYVSSDYGRPGSYAQVAAYTESQPEWTRAQIDLRQFVGSHTVRLMFLVEDRSDVGNYPGFNGQSNGWYLDDIRVEELPQDVVLSPITSSSMHHVTLNWTQNTEGDFARYEIYRATNANVTRSSTLLKTITDRMTTTYTDSVAMIQPTHYSYRVYVIDTLSTSSLGSEVRTASYPVPENTFPFQDSMSDTTTKWAWGTPWGPTTATCHSAPSSWTDSPGASYENNANTALATVVDLSGSSEPVLTFWHRYDLETNADYGYVEVSSDGGNTWSAVLTVTGTDTAWQRERVTLNPWIGQRIGLRFRLQSNGSASQDGWYIDDVEIANSTRVASYPFSDDVESDTTAWFSDSPWGYETTNSHSGTRHWSDSPAGNYADNTSSALTLTINLSSATMPVLIYWERYSFEPNADYGFVEVSTDGVNWSQYAFVTGAQTEWRQRRVDLSNVAGSSLVRVRFRTQSNTATNSDGWHIDDITIGETPLPAVPYPFADSFEGDSAAKWLVSGWTVTTGGRSAPYQITDSPLGNYPPNSRNRLISAGVFDLSHATHPTLIFWHKYWFYSNHSCCTHNEDDYGRVLISSGYGHSGTWTQLASYGGTQSDWTRVQLDLSQFAGQSAVRVLYQIEDRSDVGNYPGFNGQSDGWYLDDIRMEELPLDVQISPITSSSLHHVTLNWTQNQDSDFGRYEIYRATTTDVTRSSQLVKTTTNQATTTWTDTVALIQPTHYSYRIYVYDTLGTVSLGSNVVTAGYSIPENAFPFKDSMNVSTPNWDWGAPWGPTTGSYHSPPSSWKSDPIQAYKPNANTALATRINLAGATAPVLTF